MSTSDNAAKQQQQQQQPPDFSESFADVVEKLSVK